MQEATEEHDQSTAKTQDHKTGDEAGNSSDGYVAEDLCSDVTYPAVTHHDCRDVLGAIVGWTSAITNTSEPDTLHKLFAWVPRRSLSTHQGRPLERP